MVVLLAVEGDGRPDAQKVGQPLPQVVMFKFGLVVQEDSIGYVQIDKVHTAIDRVIGGEPLPLLDGQCCLAQLRQRQVEPCSGGTEELFRTGRTAQL